MERIHEKIEIEADVPAAPKSDIIETFNCPICGEDQSVFKLFSFDGCGHTYCTDVSFPLFSDNIKVFLSFFLF
jgi:hypothetical protein